ncbi:MAG: energy transducer TonB, partial [Bacteroidales bacterium]|nr:energy transducer TonB [Bacteroidales bacterium]
ISADDSNTKIDIKPYVEAKPVEEAEVEEEEIPFAIVEDKPLFQGKDANEFTKWVYSNIEYPEIAKENGIQGRVTVAFTIDKDGSVKDVKVLRGVDSSLDKEAVRVIQKSPKWSPGKQRGKAVKVKYTFPIIFQLR